MPDYSSRPCEGAADLNLLIEIARTNLAERLPGLSYWHPGDIAWRLTALDPRAVAANVRLWSDDRGVAAATIFEPPLNVEFDICADRQVDGPLLDEMLAWAEARRQLIARTNEDVPIAYSMLGEGHSPPLLWIAMPPALQLSPGKATLESIGTACATVAPCPRQSRRLSRPLECGCAT